MTFHVDTFDNFLSLEKGSSPRTREAYRRDVERLAEYATIKGLPAGCDEGIVLRMTAQPDAGAPFSSTAPDADAATSPMCMYENCHRNSSCWE